MDLARKVTALDSLLVILVTSLRLGFATLDYPGSVDLQVSPHITEKAAVLVHSGSRPA